MLMCLWLPVMLMQHSVIFHFSYIFNSFCIQTQVFTVINISNKKKSRILAELKQQKKSFHLGDLSGARRWWL